MARNIEEDWEINEEEVVEGGWCTVNGERRFKPLRIKKVARCSSCLFFNRKYEKCSRGYYCYADSLACDEYINRTWR